MKGVAEEVSPQLVSILESLLFASEKPLKPGQIKKLLGERSLARVKHALRALTERRAETGIVVVEVDGGFQLRTHPDNARWVKRLQEVKPVRVSRAALEVMAVVAYRQPVARAEVDQIRGVDSGAVLKQLLQRDLVRIVGRKDEPGRPFLYGTTHEFLSFFGLASLSELPSLRDVAELAKEEEVEPGRPERDEVAPADAAAEPGAHAQGAAGGGEAAGNEDASEIPDEVGAEDLVPDEEEVKEFDEGDDELLDALTEASDAAKGAERVKRSLRKMANDESEEVAPQSEAGRMLSSLQEVVAVRQRKKKAAEQQAAEAEAEGEAADEPGVGVDGEEEPKSGAADDAGAEASPGAGNETGVPAPDPEPIS